MSDDAPAIGSRVKLRGRPQRGVLRGVNPDSLWARVEWDAGAKGPVYCHLKELESEPAP